MKHWRVVFLRVTGNQIEPWEDVMDIKVGADTKAGAVNAALQVVDIAGSIAAARWDRIDVREIQEEEE